MSVTDLATRRTGRVVRSCIRCGNAYWSKPELLRGLCTLCRAPEPPPKPTVVKFMSRPKNPDPEAA